MRKNLFLVLLLSLTLIIGCASSGEVKKDEQPYTMTAEAKKQQELKMINELLKKGDIELQKKNFDAAINLYEQALRIQPNSIIIKNNIESARRQKENVMKAAIAAAAKTKMTSEMLAKELIQIGEEKLKTGKTEEALGYFKRATQMDSSSPLTWFALGSKLHNLNRIEEAIPFYEKAISLNSNYILAHRNLGIALTEINQLDTARQHLDYAIKQNPNDPQTLRGLAMWDRISARALNKEAEDFENRASQLEQPTLTPQAK